MKKIYKLKQNILTLKSFQAKNKLKNIYGLVESSMVIWWGYSYNKYLF